VLIIEGADLVGKTTFVKQATAMLHSRGYAHMPMHLTRPPAEFDYFRQYIDLCSPQTVWDRFHVSTLAYRQHDDHPCALTPVKFDLVEAAVRAVGGYVVVLYADDDQLCERHMARGDDMYGLEHIMKVNRTFKSMATDYAVDVRGARYRYRVDAFGNSTTRDDAEAWLVEKVVDGYLERLDEIMELAL